MAGSSPTRQQSYNWASGSPQRTVLEEILADDRNSEARHRYLLEAAKREHERVREDAERVYWEQLQKEERQRLLDERRKEEERIKLEEQLAAERVRLNALKAKKIAIPPPLPDPEPPVAPAVKGKAPAPPPATNAPAQANGTGLQPAAPAAASLPDIPVAKPPAAPLAPQPQSQKPATVLPKAPEPTRPASTPLGINGLLNNTPQSNGITSSSGTSRSPAPPPAQTRPDRYAEIHKNLKILRKSMADQAKTNPALKERMGDMRREIRKSVGQLTVSSGVAGVNKIQV
jgi:nucleoporin GLE1